MVAELNHLVELNRAQQISEEDVFTERRYKQFVRRFHERTNKVLDVGCGIGRGGSVMKTILPGLDITGLDCIPERIARLDLSIYNSSICSFTQTIPLASESFDAIVAGEFIEHVPPQLVFPTLCEFFRLLRLKGLLLLTTPNPHYLVNKFRRRSVLGWAHVSQHHPKSLKRRLEDVGFSRVRMRGSGRVSILLGERFPLFAAYGSYLAEATKW
jgi:2-polyprenyl-3-methyl-5-hydroxy-6-metoxy-1,4-benzoquinol methylase